MKCPVCNIIEMRVNSLINGEFTCECPKCHETVTLKITEPDTPNAEEVKIELKK